MDTFTADASSISVESAPERAVLTIATGKAVYWKIAVALARSFERWNAHNDIRFVILTDTCRRLPPSLKRTEVVVAPEGSLAGGFSSKLQLDQFAPAERTLFIDADCLCLATLEPVFERFAGHSVSVIGDEVSEGEWYGDVKSICTRTGVSALPKFNGGVYYLERGEKANLVYKQARNLEPRYDELGMLRLRNKPNDELLMAAAMAKFGCVSIEDDGSLMGDLYATPEVVRLDVLKGQGSLRNPDPSSPYHRPRFPVRTIQPAIIHFLDFHITERHYRAEALKLWLTTDARWPDWAASVAGRALKFVLRTRTELKSALRPAYHRVFGIRKVKPGPR